MKAYNRKHKPKHWTKGKWKTHEHYYYIFTTRYSKKISKILNDTLISWIIPVNRYNRSKVIRNFSKI